MYTVSLGSFPSINQPSGTTDEFSVTLNWELSNENVDLFDNVVIFVEWTSLLVYDGGINSKRQITGNTATTTISDPTVTHYTYTDLQPFSHYCFTVTAQYAFEGQTLGEVASEPFCTNTSEAGKIIIPYKYCIYLCILLLLLCTIFSSICTTKCNGVVSGIHLAYSDLDRSSVIKWHHTTLYSKSSIPQYSLMYIAVFNVQYS